jgi:hypothetical protein
MLSVTTLSVWLTLTGAELARKCAISSSVLPGSVHEPVNTHPWQLPRKWALGTSFCKVIVSEFATSDEVW